MGDQLNALHWAKNDSEMLSHIDLSAPAGITGHSMGGLATLRSASNKKELEALNIAAAVAQHPAECLYIPVEECSSSSLVPIMFTAGEKDDLTPHVRYKYNETHGVQKVFAEFAGVGHTDPSTAHYPQSDNWAGPPRVENHYVLDWFNCILKKNATACHLAQCNEPQSTYPLKSCTTDGFTHFTEDINPVLV